MGYTHYWVLDAYLTDEAIRDIQEIVKCHKDILQLEFNDSNYPIVNRDLIQLNGIGNDGYETFLLEPFNRGFCKTARKPYDIVVCEVLLVLKHHYGNNIFELDSDGFGVGREDFYNDICDGCWNEAIQEVKSLFGYTFQFTHETSDSGGRTYYSLGIE